ncbi:beta-ketoacyl-ACP synthase III [Lentimicrobium sp. S6]|uniref:beta-ketoacyl-ACP synthase III n=1 Tax=Lentimicrobium sp. S6 TaxID=2735872 RepID=UPI001D574FE0|nr:beta-ketoacyl-ACP synthase III [Lentimicrobium sp. S6]NPD84399.1 beta-ketoacyl-ACP synthase III [Lentimicrobium sp. L6]
MNHVYITALSKFLPNQPVPNEEMEDYLGLIDGKPSKSKRIILRYNKIKTRYYALDKNGNSTHSNAQLCAEAIRNLESSNFCLKDMELLAGGSSSPDQLLPSHVSMVQGELGPDTINSTEILSAGGSCNAGMQALKYAYLSVMSGNTKNAVSFGSEKQSTWMHAKNFKLESENWKDLEKQPIIGFEKDFLRWMLSDGAAAALLENKPNKEGHSLKIEWIEFRSFSNELETCMYAACDKLKDGSIKPWRDYDAEEIMTKSLFSLRQDVKLLGKNIIKKGGEFLREVMDKRDFGVDDVDYFLPHLSSEFFRAHIIEDLTNNDIVIPQEKWFTNLTRVGNVGAASVYLMMEELFNTNKLKKGDKLLLMVPESARFSYAYALLTVV